MKTLILLTNAAIVLSTSVCASRLYGSRWKSDAHHPRRRLPATFIIIGITLAISLSQFIWPQLITAPLAIAHAVDGGIHDGSFGTSRTKSCRSIRSTPDAIIAIAKNKRPNVTLFISWVCSAFTERIDESRVCRPRFL